MIINDTYIKPCKCGKCENEHQAIIRKIVVESENITYITVRCKNCGYILKAFHENN